MNQVVDFFLSRIIGCKLLSEAGAFIGTVKDLSISAESGLARPMIIAVKAKIEGQIKIIDISPCTLQKEKGKYILRCKTIHELNEQSGSMLFLVHNVMDKQIVDMYGRKVVRVNDVKLAMISSGMIVVAVDVGIEGLLRRLGIAKSIKSISNPIWEKIPSNLIAWTDVEAFNFTNLGLKLSTSYTRLSTLHSSDLADIIEDLDRETQAAIFASLDEDKAADVLEELETDVQISVLKSMSVENAADILEKMPADEAADILDEMEENRAEELLQEMEEEASEEIRELLEYDDNAVGSLMATDFISFRHTETVNDVLLEMRKQKPESDIIYYLYILDEEGKLSATVSLRDLVISEPETKISEIMNPKIIFVHDTDDIRSLAEIISKYNLLAIAVVDKNMVMVGTVIIDDVVHDLLRIRRRKA